MLALLLSGGVIDLALGDLRRALILTVFALASTVITVAPETRTKRALEALRDPTSPRALVIRTARASAFAGIVADGRVGPAVQAGAHGFRSRRSGATRRR
ncbi:hypothetical protein [Bosea psychrotolerans]|uniref:hypothetical protein n=1 Tax=Bosea psychrotolerans TaxID=1871628 RepID=UPI0015E1888A